MTTTTKVLIGIGVALLIGIIFYFVIKDYKTVNEELLLELNKTGELIRYSDSLVAYTAYINEKKSDSIIALNKDLEEAIKNSGTKKELVYVYNTKTEYINVPANTRWVDTVGYLDPGSFNFGYRTASIKEKWLDFNAFYKVVEPYDFVVSNITIPDSLILVQTINKFGRKTIFVKNKNPYVHVNGLEAIVEPDVITKTILDKDHWQYMLNYTYTPGSKVTNTTIGVFSPMGLGVVGGYNNIPEEFKLNYHIGIGYTKKF